MQGMIVGGDARSRHLAQLLHRDGMDVVHALQTQPQLDWQQLCQMDFVVLPANFLGGVVRGEAGQISGIEIARHLKHGAQLYCGCADAAMHEQCKRGEVRLIEMLHDPIFVYQNALLTAEAAVMRAIQLTCGTLYQSHCVIIGAGRIAQGLLSLLRPFTPHLTLVARSTLAREQAEWQGVQAVPLIQLPAVLQTADFIFNTVPARIMPTWMKEPMQPGTIYMELASPPYGMDPDAASDHIVYALEAGLPGKISPLAAARAMQRVLVHTWEETQCKTSEANELDLP